MVQRAQHDARLAELRQTRLLDSGAEEAFDRLTRLASLALGVPVALVSLVDEDRQYFKSCIGLPEPWNSERQTPLSHSFCQHVASTAEPLVISDAREHPLVRDNLAVKEIGVVAYAGFPLTTDDGYVLGSFCAIDVKPRHWSGTDLAILRDLAAAATSEIRMKRSKEEAEAANRSKDRFLAVLSHELRTPLSPVLMIADSLLADETLPAHVRDDCRTIQRNIQLETRLIDDLLDVTRIENGKLSLRVEPLDLHAVLIDAMALCREDAVAKGIGMSLDAGAAQRGVWGDPVRLRQAFTNLLKNAVKFTPSSGSVVIRSCAAPDGCISVSVADTGIGIEPAFLSKVFDAFEQGGRSMTAEFSGLGLGLAITKALVEAHGGTIAASSEGKGRGTTFTVELPADEAMPVVSQKPVAAPPPAAAPCGNMQPLNILLVDDHRDTLNVMSRLLRRLQYRVTTADSVGTALAAATAEPFDVLISDVGLPDGTGLDLMRELRKHRPIRGIAITGYGMDTDIQESREAGYSAHLTKPVDFGQLEAILAEPKV